MIDQSIRDWIANTIESSYPGTRGRALAKLRKRLHEEAKAAIRLKMNGAKCDCGKPIWANGVALGVDHMCFTCTTGEADSSTDYEFGECNF